MKQIQKIIFFIQFGLCHSVLILFSEEITISDEVVWTQQDHELMHRNTQRAQNLISALYSEYSEKSSDPILGYQASYYGKPSDPENEMPLTKYGRIGAYDVGISLSLAVADRNLTAPKRALWLKEKSHYLADPGNIDQRIFGGWPFSMNQIKLGDDFTDPRYVTGANAWALLSIAEYITAYGGQEEGFKDFFAEALAGLLYHIQTTGANQDLVTAGWTVKGLLNATSANQYNGLLDSLGYNLSAEKLLANGLSGDALDRMKALNVVTEHNIDLLALLNYTIDHYDQIFTLNSPYSLNELNTIRITLRDAIFEKLYNTQERRFITGRTPEGIPSTHTAIDNTTWLCSALKLEELSTEHVGALADGLHYTVEEFTKDFVISDKTYFGAYYFQDEFKDPYISEDGLKSDSYHIEATAGLIISLHDFADAFPSHTHSPHFRYVALDLWKNMQYFVEEFGLKHSSISIKNLFVSLDSHTSAVWFLRAYKNYFQQKGQQINPWYLNED
jgi:hypothetical protein